MKADGARKCAEFLAECLRIGWRKSDLDALEKLWLDGHDEHGNLKPRADQDTTPMRTPEEENNMEDVSRIRTNKPAPEGEQHADTATSDVPPLKRAFNGLVLYPCPLGDGRFAELRLPSNFDQADEARLHKYVAALALPSNVTTVTLQSLLENYGVNAQPPSTNGADRPTDNPVSPCAPSLDSSPEILARSEAQKEIERLTKELARVDVLLAESDALIGASITARVKAEQERAWQPIETAPKDGTEILVWGVTFLEPGAHKAYWSDNRYNEPTPQMAWCIANSQDRDYNTADEVRSPTHWMPLPAPPQDAK